MSQLSTSPARVSVQRRIEWIDTDAAGIYHWTTACRLAEAAEAVLHTALGIERFTFGATPRVAVELNFRRSLRFNDVVDVELRVDHVGRSSVRYAIAIGGPDGLAVDGMLTACLVDRGTGTATAWPDEIRQAFLTAGPQAELSC